VECLETRTLLNNRFVVPLGAIIDNQSTFGSLHTALTTPGLAVGDVIQIEPGSLPGALQSNDLPAIANLTIQGDAAYTLASIPGFYITSPVNVRASQSGFTLHDVNVGLAGTGSLRFSTIATITSSSIVDLNSRAPNALVFAGTTDVLENSTLVNNSTLPTGSSLLLVNPVTGSSNSITGNTFLGNAPSDALAIYQAGQAVTVQDVVAGNTFVATPGSNLEELLFVGEPFNTVTASGQISGLTIQNNGFTDSDTDVAAIELRLPGAGTTVAGNAIDLTAGHAANRGIVVVAGPASTTAATISGNQINTHAVGTGLKVDLGGDTTSVLNLNVQGNDFHTNGIGVLIRAGAASTASVASIDLGGGSQGSLGGNVFTSFGATATINSAAIVLSGVQSSQGTVTAQKNIFAAGASPSAAVYDTQGNLDLSSPLGGNAAFVDQMYDDFLRRPGNTTNTNDAAGWINMLNNGAISRQDVANDIIHAGEAAGILVDGLSLKLLGQPVDSNSRSMFIGQLVSGTSLEQVISEIVTLPAYAALYSNDASFVQSLYTKLLGRPGSAGEISGWLSVLSKSNRSAVALDFLGSTEFRADAAQELYGFMPAPAASPASLLSDLLHRGTAPQGTEISFWAQSSTPLLGVEVAFAGSAEFFGGGPTVAPAPPVPLPILHRHQAIVPALTRQVVNTVPTNGDVNPYGVAYVPQNFPTNGTLQPGDIVVSNFNDATNTQGTGLTIDRITPSGNVSTFFTTTTQIGLSTALGVLQAGFVVVGNVPNLASIPQQGSIQVIDKNGNVVLTITDATLLNGPWDLTVNDQGNTAQIFVSTVSTNVSATAAPNGTVTRIDLTIQNGVPAVQDKVQIASGYATRTDAAAFVVGPGGLAYDAAKDTLYVASQVEKVNGNEVGTIFSIANAGTTTTDNGKGTVVYADPAHLRGPIGLALAPNGDLVAANSDAANSDPEQPSQLVEFTKSGQFVGQFEVDPTTAATFGLAFSNPGRPPQIAVVDDGTNTLQIFNFVPGFGNLEVRSTVPPQTGTTPPPADLNPYGIAFAPTSFPTGGTLQPGDLLVSNFNDPTNTSGTGTTVVRITPTGQRSTFFVSSLPGLTDGLAVLQSGFVIVANVPNNSGTPGQGALQILDANGKVVSTLTDANLLNGPWDLTVNDQGNFVQVFVSTVSKNVKATPSPNGTVTRIDMSIQNGNPVVDDMIQIGSGYTTRTDPSGFVVGPGGLAFDAFNNTLYVAAEAEMVNGAEVGTIFAIPSAGTTSADHGKGSVVYADAGHLRAPMGLVLAPNGDLITTNNDVVNGDPTQTSELVEFTRSGQFVAQYSMDANPGGAFNLALFLVGSKLEFASVNDNVGPGSPGSAYSMPTVSVWSFDVGAPLAS
jgi:hypothetical protein